MSNKLFIFDLDGVLVEACDWHKDALNKALQQECGFSISEEEHKKIFNGLPTKIKLKMLNKQGKVREEQYDRIEDLKQSNTIDIIKNNANERQEKINMLNILREKGHTVCCYTNSIRKTAELMLEKTGIKDKFHFILTNRDVEKPKPDPEGYVYLMTTFNFSPADTYIIEDSPKGIEAATRSGANVVKVKNSYSVDIKLLEDLI